MRLNRKEPVVLLFRVHCEEIICSFYIRVTSTLLHESEISFKHFEQQSLAFTDSVDYRFTDLVFLNR